MCVGGGGGTMAAMKRQLPPWLGYMYYIYKTDKSKTHTFTFGGNKKLELDRPNLFLARYENLRRD